MSKKYSIPKIAETNYKKGKNFSKNMKLATGVSVLTLSSAVMIATAFAQTGTNDPVASSAMTHSIGDSGAQVQVVSQGFTDSLYGDISRVFSATSYSLSAEEVILAPRDVTNVMMSEDYLINMAVESALDAAQAELDRTDALVSEVVYTNLAVDSHAAYSNLTLENTSSIVNTVNAAVEQKKAEEEAAKKKAEEEAKKKAEEEAAKKKAAEEAAKKEVKATYSSGVTGISDEDYNNLLRIVQAEAENQGDIGKILVANVIINRVKSSKYPNTITGVIFQKKQFSPVSDGRFYKVKVTDSTKKAVDRALAGEDYSEGALFFANYRYTGGFFKSLTFLFQHKDHCFYK